MLMYILIDVDLHVDVEIDVDVENLTVSVTRHLLDNGQSYCPAALKQSPPTEAFVGSFDLLFDDTSRSARYRVCSSCSPEHDFVADRVVEQPCSAIGWSIKKPRPC